MEGIITSFRRSRHVQKNNQMIIEFSEEEKDLKSLVGKKIVFKTQTGNEIQGEIRAKHGTKPNKVRAMFEKGMPGQAIGKKVTLK